MIRKFKEKDLDAVLQIWLESNLQAHPFIAQTYWEDNYDMVRQEILNAEIWVYEIEALIVGFIGLTDNFIAGIFINHNYQSKGIGRQLLTFVKEKHSDLVLHVYEKNKRAVRFYLKEGFEIRGKQLDQATNETELVMKWQSFKPN